MSGDNGGPLPEGSTSYQITVTSGDGETTNTYSIDVILLPDLSLQTFKIVKEEEYFERDLAAVDTQNVYLPYPEGITLIAEANGDGASVNQESADIPNLNTVSDNVTVTVTVSKNAGAAGEYSKDYVLNLYYGADADLTPLATGGFISFIPGESAGVYYEAHTLLDPGESTLSFFDTSVQSVRAGYLIVAGGGGGGVIGKGNGGAGTAGLGYNQPTNNGGSGGSGIVIVRFPREQMP